MNEPGATRAKEADDELAEVSSPAQASLGADGSLHTLRAILKYCENPEVVSAIPAHLRRVTLRKSMAERSP